LKTGQWRAIRSSGRNIHQRRRMPAGKARQNADVTKRWPGIARGWV
jgi:hypothetical protein